MKKKAVIELLVWLSKKMKLMVDGLIYEKKPYSIDWNHLLRKYKELEMEDLREFAIYYTHNYHIHNYVLGERESKEKMLSEIMKKFSIEKEKMNLL